MSIFCDYKKKKNKAKDLEKRHKLFKNMFKILRKLKISELKNIDEEQKVEIRKALLWLKKKTPHIWEEGK